MKLNRLESTTQPYSGASVERARRVAGEKVRRVELTEGIEGDRQRSLQQELAEFDGQAAGPFEGGERVLLEARAVAAQLTSLGAGAGALLKAVPPTGAERKVDDQA
ncbi:MAG: hypothetical protein H6R15_1900 [Proteobacteria bacterium]|nr:hypothetical protein [Pseudomonadota bacterium]